jgi:hypothetical protein
MFVLPVDSRRLGLKFPPHYTGRADCTNVRLLRQDANASQLNQGAAEKGDWLRAENAGRQRWSGREVPVPFFIHFFMESL